MVNFNNNSKYKNSQVGYKLNTTNSAYFNKTYESSTNGTVNGSFFVTSKSTKLNGSSVNFSYTNNQWKAN